LEVQHLFFPRTLKCLRLLDFTERAAEKSKLIKDVPKKKKQKQNGDVRGLTVGRTGDSETDIS
jgi:cell division FtsZ-interacting protein ZapD